MNKHLLTVMLTSALSVSVMAQAPTPPTVPAPPPPPTAAENVAPPKPWTMDLQTGLNLNQASYSDNWKAGGTNSVAISVFLNGKANRKWNRSEWSNDLQLLYGNIQNKGQDLKKNADRIFFESKYAYRLHKHWNAFGSVNFMSQFADGYEYYFNKDSAGADIGAEQSRRISGFLAPGYLTEAIGFEYKPVSYFSCQFGLGALRQTFVIDQSLYDVPGNSDSAMYGVLKGQNVRNQVVFQFVAQFDKEIMKNIFLKARYLGIMDYERIDSKYLISRLDAGLTAKVNKFVNVNLTGVILYDFDQDKDVQFSQVLSLGILYGISNHSDK